MLSLRWGKRWFFIFTKSTQRNRESVTMATCWQACVMEAWGWPPAERAAGRGAMARPFMNEAVGIEADIIQSQLSQERLIRLRVNVLSFPEEYPFGRYRLLLPHMGVTYHGCAPSSQPIFSIALWSFASGNYNIGDTEPISKAPVCRASAVFPLAAVKSKNSAIKLTVAWWRHRQE